ncbi:MAG: hypothetical protein S4CHLAM123_05310 [Chlamydiales bacterium]|nr:hypothetical protein [Chlamydiales bacterium]
MQRKFFLFALILINICTLGFAAEEDEVAIVFDEEALIAAIDNLGPTASGFSSEGDFGPEDESFVDPRVLRDFIESRGLIKCRQKEGTLSIYGDVRARWATAGEMFGGEKQRGQGTSIANDRYKSEINLFFDYVAPRAWVSTKLKWVNFDGKDGGSATRVEMDRGFIGYDIYHQGEQDFYIEVGRSKLDFIYESRVEFISTFDGIHIYYTNCWPSVGKFTIHGGPFLIDTFTNHYAWIMETFITGWYNTGFSLKYSIVDWHRGAPTLDYGNLKKPDDPITSGNLLVQDNPRYNFLVSQMLFGYERKIDFIRCKTLFVYGAVLKNHIARRSPQTNNKLLNNAWYAGFTLGKLCKGCDWSIDINFQSVQAQAVPEFDSGGIGHGNAANGLLSDAILLGLPIDEVHLFTNYKGLAASLLYALTDSLSFRLQGQYSTPRNKGIGKDFYYKDFELSVIYAF